MNVVTGNQLFFKETGAIKYEGPETDNPLAFRWYNAEKVVAGKPMKEWLRFACAYWHSFVGNGADPFGEPTHLYLWNVKADPIERAKDKMDAAFEFITKMNMPFYCFHDVDVVDFTNDLIENEKRLLTMVEYAKQKQTDSGVQLLWGTANLFSHRKYMNGAATNPDFLVLTHAAAQVKAALDATIALGGANYVFWGGREGYMSLLNTNMKREKEHMARFLHTAKDYARRNGFTGTFFIEPKPCEPTKHQYDYDSETVIGFLREYDLLNDFKLNIEVNHATLAGHTFQHELQVAVDAGVLGSMDANRGDYQNGWDTDQFPNNINEITEAMLVILEAGGFKGGGINFDAKRRRNSTDNLDLFYAHIGAMDTFARALEIADKILTQSDYKKIRTQRYASFDSGEGKAFEEGKLSLEDLRNFAVKQGTPATISGQQEYLESIINRYI
ncbi:MAG: xylose isomerase [Hydrotalea flava]|uniref:xylose isomerase n=1 Tax=Hydrotalea TaxID=1004300 RepID=UPI000944B2A3|nr:MULTISPECIES: xylose isomerase [Hydrotalea]MBY0349132.1 xylose isomerase [Hydrotalea flava]NIM33893.1 xylose isomerase [Hydrotalea flava]NIM36722.1 xylose isomerase [Hydrotalea flava]NIN01908.1 xylose isomerase [Hydrotalea flava]NIN13566.1 xylose isomerase [Hydrotalea flava]